MYSRCIVSLITSIQLPTTLTSLTSAIIAGFIKKTGKYPRLIWLGWALTVLGTGIMILLDITTSTIAWIFVTMIPGFGVGFLITATAVGLQATASIADVTFAAAMVIFFRYLGQNLGVATGGNIFQNQVEKAMLKFSDLAPQAAENSRDAASLAQIIAALPPGPRQEHLMSSYVQTLKILWTVLCAFAASGFLLSLLIKEHSLDRKQETTQNIKEKK